MVRTSKPVDVATPPTHQEDFAERMDLIAQDAHMRIHHRTGPTLFLSRAGTIERHTDAHRREREARLAAVARG